MHVTIIPDPNTLDLTLKKKYESKIKLKNNNAKTNLNLYFELRIN